MRVRVIGLFRETEPDARRELPGIRDVAGQLDESWAKRVMAFLEGGQVFMDVMGLRKDPFDAREILPRGLSLVTDGSWIWQADLCDLVERYRVGLPQEFLDHVATAKPLSPEDRAQLVRRARDLLSAFDDARFPRRERRER